jgi:hypothetical protein
MMKGERKSGWLEPGDKVRTGDLVVLRDGELKEETKGGYTHKSHHMPKWRPPFPLPSMKERQEMLDVAREVQDRWEQEKRDRYGRSSK